MIPDGYRCRLMLISVLRTARSQAGSAASGRHVLPGFALQGLGGGNLPVDAHGADADQLGGVDAGAAPPGEGVDREFSSSAIATAARNGRLCRISTPAKM